MGAIDMAMTDPGEPKAPLRVVTAGEGAWTDYAAAWLGVQDRLFRIALLVATDRRDAEDAVADAMASTFQPWTDGRVESLDAYGRRAVLNALTGHGRRQVVAARFGRRRTGDDRGVRAIDDEVADRDAVRRALAALGPRQRAIVACRFYDRLSVAETAAALGCSEGTVKSQTHDALATLRARLGQAEEA
ncbi:MAG: sigma-70 family RNA polymerase sigma factor [Acidimicrobiales bacterium]